jgi:hypothetical protein
MDQARKRFWIPIILSVLITPIFLFLGIASTGAGHGNYFFAQVLFPYTMLSFLLFDTITGPFIGFAFIQYILYGFIIGKGFRSGRVLRVFVLIASVHSVAVLLCFVSLGQYVRQPWMSGSRAFQTRDVHGCPEVALWERTRRHG